MTHDLMTLIINLDSSTDRMRQVTDAFDQAGLDWERFPAVDFRGRRAEELENYNRARCERRYGRTLVGGEVGCYLSHVNALAYFVEAERDYLFLAEDDLVVSPNAMALIEDLISGLNRDRGSAWDSVYVERSNRPGYERFAFTVGKHKVLRNAMVPSGTAGIIWSRSGARAFLASGEGQRISGPVDAEMRSFKASRGRSYTTKPPMFECLDVESDISPAGEKDESRKTGRSGSSFPSKLVRHFPDQLNALFSVLRWKLEPR